MNLIQWSGGDQSMAGSQRTPRAYARLPPALSPSSGAVGGVLAKPGRRLATSGPPYLPPAALCLRGDSFVSLLGEEMVAYDQQVPKVIDIVTALAERTRPENAAQWDPVGLQIGDPDAQVSSVAVCHEVTDAVVAAVAADPVDLLVTYHPLLFEPVNRLLAGRSPASRAFRLLGLGINILVTHTDFDSAPGGAADALASVLKLRDVEPFGDDPEVGLPAIGRVGSHSGTLAVIDALVSDLWGHAGLRISGERSRTVDRVAVVPGSGSDFISQAAEVADALVTGDVSHHRAVAALDLGLAVVDPGHVATERPGMSALVDLVSEVSQVAVTDLTLLDPATWS